MPVPNFASKRRYEATPSSIIMPRPLAPHTDALAETDESRLGPKSKQVGPTPPSGPLHNRPPEKERNVSRYPPLAQATSAPMPAGPLLEDPARTMSSQAALPPRLQGPRLGYFDDRREIPATVLSHAATSRPQETPLSVRQTPVSASEMARLDPLHAQSFRTAPVDVHRSPLLPQNTLPGSQQAYLQPQAQAPLIHGGSHSRQTSLTKTPSSPAQPLQRAEPDISPIRRDSVSQRPYFALHGQHVALSQPPPVLSPPKEPSRPGSTPGEAPEAPRVPAKRSNIMSILNDEPEEPQPRKRFASEQTSSTPAMHTGSPSRPVYSGMHPLSQQPPRQDEAVLSSQPRAPAYAPSQYLPPSRAYAEYQPYGSVPGGSAAPANNDWMARFDPRGQPPPPPPQQPPQAPSQPGSRPTTTLAPQPPYSPYTSAQPLSNPSLPNLTAPSPVPTPSQPPQRQAYHASAYAPSPVSHAQATAAASRELAAQNQMYRQAISSPTPRNNSLAYGSRQGPPTPIQTSANILGMTSRQPAATVTYASPAPATPGPSHMSAQQHAAHQSYQQHVQTMVSGAHQQAAHRSTLGLSTPYGHNTPPPQAQVSRNAGMPGPPPMSMGRSYTPPAILQPSPGGGLSYAPSGPSSAVGSMHPMQGRPPGSLVEVPGGHGTPGHHRVYSQGSTPQHPR